MDEIAGAMRQQRGSYREPSDENPKIQRTVVRKSKGKGIEKDIRPYVFSTNSGVGFTLQNKRAGKRYPYSSGKGDLARKDVDTIMAVLQYGYSSNRVVKVRTADAMPYAIERKGKGFTKRAEQSKRKRKPYPFMDKTAASLKNLPKIFSSALQPNVTNIWEGRGSARVQFQTVKRRLGLKEVR